MMGKKIVAVKIDSEHDMPEGRSQMFLVKLKEFIGEEYDITKLRRAIEAFGAKKEVLGIGMGYLYSALPAKGNKGSFRIYAAYANVSYEMDLE